jgi:regulation of enolase protein 1 (concanavalin A-like superfamily)
MRRRVIDGIVRTSLSGLLLLAMASAAAADERLCDASFENCRAPLIQLIQNENVGLDVAFWFMQDARYEVEIIKRWKAGVPVRVLVDPKANPTYPGNDQVLADLAAAGIPMRQRAATAAGILHWKMMLFAGQGVVEFSGANFSPTAFVPQTPYADYEDEVIYFSDDPSVVNSFMTEYDNLWIDTVNYTDYANLLNPPARIYPIYPKDSALNFPQQEDYALRLLKRYPKEKQQIDVVMYRITDERETNAVITAFQRGIPIRLISDTFEYRKPLRQWHSYNLDKLWAAGVPVKVRAHAGLNHQKLVLFYNNQPAVGASGPLSVFGSSNWTTPSANQQQEHNYFTLKRWMFDWFRDMFERKWNNANPDGVMETDWFVPLPPDKPINLAPADGALNVTTTQKLKWNGGFFAHFYDIYFGVDPNPPLFAQHVKLGPVDYQSPKVMQTFALPALQPGTTYYWRIVSSTMAGLTAKGAIFSFTTKGVPPMPPPPPAGVTTQVIWAADVQPTAIVGAWQVINDPTAAGGKALWNPDKGKSKISPPLAAPLSYFEATFTATAGVPYHLWIRMRAQANSTNNDSVSAQFSDSADSFGSPMYRIGAVGGAEVVLHNGVTDAISGWGWNDNGFGVLGPDIYFKSAGLHTIRIQPRTDGAIVDQIVLSPDTYVRAAPGRGDNDSTMLASTISGATMPPSSPPPDPWRSSDVGVVAINGRVGYDAPTGTFSVLGDGGDVWGKADGMQFVYQPLAGDGSIVARVSGIQNTNPWARAGVMVRATLAGDSPNAFLYLSAGKTLAFQRRLQYADVTVATAGPTNVTAPYWLRLDRSGDTFTAYVSKDGITWTFVGADTVSIENPTVYVGLAVASANANAVTLGTFDNVGVTPGSPISPVDPPSSAGLPDPWTHQDVGPIGFTGDSSFAPASGSFVVRGAGADVSGNVDAMHFTYRTLNGDGWIAARVRSLQNTSSSAKAGVMIRETLAPNAANAFMLVTPGKGTAFQRRTSTGSVTTSTAGTIGKAPMWVKIERLGNTINAYQSADGINWMLIGSDTVPMASTIYVGLAVSSHNVMSAAMAVFESVSTQ